MKCFYSASFPFYVFKLSRGYEQVVWNMQQAKKLELREIEESEEILKTFLLEYLSKCNDLFLVFSTYEWIKA